MAMSLKVENYHHRMCGQLSTILAVILMKEPNGKLLVAVDHNQLMPMASETVNLIDWSHPHPNGQYPHSA